jgi:hypothetical protein
MKTKKKMVGRIDDAIGIEISLVDRPANEYSTITAVELAKRAEPVADTGYLVPREPLFPIADEASLFKKFLTWFQKAGAQGGHLVTEPDGTKHLPTSSGGKPDHRLMGAAWAALHGGYRGNKYEGPDKSKAIARLRAMYAREGMTPPGDKAATVENLEKGLYAVSQLAECVSMLDYLAESADQEADMEGDDSAMPDRLREACNQLGQILIDMAAEEVGELNSAEGAEKMAEITVVELLAALRKEKADKGADGTEKAGRKISAKNKEHIDDCTKSLKNAQSSISKAVDTYPDDENVAKSAAHIGSAMEHITKMDFTPTDEEVRGGVTTLADPPKDAAANPTDLVKAMDEALDKRLKPMNEKIEKMTEENSALKLENATLKGKVEALGSIPNPSKAMVFAPFRGGESIANAGGDIAKAEEIDPKDPNAFAKAYSQRVLPNPQLVGQSKFNGSAGSSS